jgi:thiol-disulfide isomerase/thioredoxin
MLIPFDPNILRIAAVGVIGLSGLVMIIPSLNAVVEGFVSKLVAYRGSTNNLSSGFYGGLLTGFSLGTVWSPCAGPILATIATLSATQAVSAQLILVTLAYVSGVGIPLFWFSYAGTALFTQSRKLNKHTGTIQRSFGIIMIVAALLILSNYDKVLQAKLLNIFPSYSSLLSQFESNNSVLRELRNLRGESQIDSDMPLGSSLSPINTSSLPNLGRASEFAGISTWLNTENKPLTLSNLKGKVVLVDFWTYTCINCIRTLPHVTAWYEKYKSQGFVVVGVHTPEFEFEKKTENVKNAIAQYGITYPVAQDNSYTTWNAYNNQYWPAEYLIDADGFVRRTHFGEGEYDQMESAIQTLLREAGKKVDGPTKKSEETTPRTSISPETYVGGNRMARFASRELPQKGVANYTDPDRLPLHAFAFNGRWSIQPEYSVADKQSSLSFHFSAKHVYLVMRPKQKGDRVHILIDGKKIEDAQSGSDVHEGVIELDTDRLYEIVHLQSGAGDHTVRLEFENGGVEVFAFTFG